MPSAIAKCVLPVPGWAQRDDALLGVQEVELAEVLDHGLLHAALEAEVELLQGLSGREARLADAGLTAMAVTRADLGLEQQLGEALIAPLLGSGAVGKLRQRPRGGGRLQRPEQVSELARRGAHAISRS